jgi:lipid-binding SYLF domain-containing protein
MKMQRWLVVVFIGLALGVTQVVSQGAAIAASAAEIDFKTDAALKDLSVNYPWSAELARDAKGVLVFPGIVKGGFFVGGQYGEGALRKQSKTVAYYNTVSVSYGYQFGLQEYGYVMFFMTESSLRYLNKSDGWEIGVGPSIVVLDKGTARAFTTTTTKADIYAFFFDQKGLMAGLGLQGTKITKMDK